MGGYGIDITSTTIPIFIHVKLLHPVLGEAVFCRPSDRARLRTALMQFKGGGCKPYTLVAP